MNMIGSLRGSDSKLLRSLTKTYRSAFPTVSLYPVHTSVADTNPTAVLNVILVAGDGAAPSQDFLRERWQAMREHSPSAPSLDRAIRDRWDKGVRLDDVPVLTDDYAPTDALLTD